MGKNDDLLIRLVDSVARIESKIEGWANIPARVVTIEEKFATYENKAKGGWKAITLAWTIILTIGGFTMVLIENIGLRAVTAVVTAVGKGHQ